MDIINIILIKRDLMKIKKMKKIKNTETTNKYI